MEVVEGEQSFLILLPPLHLLVTSVFAKRGPAGQTIPLSAKSEELVMMETLVQPERSVPIFFWNCNERLTVSLPLVKQKPRPYPL